MGNEANQVTPPVVLAVAAGTAPVSGELRQVEAPVRLPVRRPTGEEASRLGDEAPYPRAPFLRAGDVRVELRWTLTNLDEARVPVELLVDPWNEFARYRPGLAAPAEAGEPPSPNFSGYQRAHVLEPLERREGVITADDMRELSVDLATVMAIQARGIPDAGRLMNRAMNQQNRSSQPDPLLGPLVPPVIAGLTGFHVGLRASGAVNVALELTVDVTDVKGDRLVGPASERPTFDEPATTIEPPAATP